MGLGACCCSGLSIVKKVPLPLDEGGGGSGGENLRIVALPLAGEAKGGGAAMGGGGGGGPMGSPPTMGYVGGSGSGP